MKHVQIGLIGCGGRASGYHLPALQKLDDVRVAAVCDLDQERARATADSLGATAYGEYAELLDKEALDAVVIATPAGVRGGPELACTEAGIPFLLEKPVASDWATANNIAAKVREAGLITCIGYQLRYGPQARAVTHWSASRRIGMAEGRYWCGTARRFEERGRSPQVNQLLEQVTHTFDLMRHWMGDVVEVYSQQNRALLAPGAAGDMPDVYAVALRFADGAVATVTSTWGTSLKVGETNVVNLFAGDEHVEYRARNVRHTPGGSLNPIAGPSIHEAFFHAVRTGDTSQILTPYDEGVKTLAVSLAANRSAATGRPVRLDATVELEEASAV